MSSFPRNATPQKLITRSNKGVLMKRLVLASLAWLCVYASQAQAYLVVSSQDDNTGSYTLAWKSPNIECGGSYVCAIETEEARECNNLSPQGLHLLREIFPNKAPVYFRLSQGSKSFSDRDAGTYEYRLWDYECYHSSGVLKKTTVYVGDVTVEVSNHGIESVTVDYHYDALGRLIRAQDENMGTRTYDYDKAGNRVKVEQ